MKLISGLAAVALAATALAQPAAAATDVPAPAAARAGTAWLATQLTDGVIHNEQYDFDDLGLTMDIGLSMDEVGGDQALVRQIRSSLSTRVAGVRHALGADRALLAARWPSRSSSPRSTGADPTTYGGLDLVSEVESRVTAQRSERGSCRGPAGPGRRLRQQLQPGARRPRPRQSPDRPSSPAATTFLLKQQCSAGYFRVFFTTDPSASEQGCVDGCRRHRHRHDRLRRQPARGHLAAPAGQVDAAIAKAVAWLVSTQKADGSFVGSAFTPDSNTNSTGLAASALAAAGRCEQAGRAAEWVGSLQVGPQPAGAPLAGDEGALAYDSDALAEREGHGHHRRRS